MLCMALRSSEHASAILDWVETTVRAIELVIAIPLSTFKKVFLVKL